MMMMTVVMIYTICDDENVDVKGGRLLAHQSVPELMIKRRINRRCHSEVFCSKIRLLQGSHLRPGSPPGGPGGQPRS